MKHYKRRSKEIHLDTPTMVLTPLTDMALILLVIFMFATIPLASRMQDDEKNKNDLEVSTTYESNQEPLATIFITKDQSGITLKINDQLIPDNQALNDVIMFLISEKPDQLIAVSAQKSVSFDEVMRVMQQLQGISGISSISLIST